ncbi:MAG TPA: hypothetical protein VJB59_16125 [Bdellovibrionota bacterium]|nr:hypothetical protein [Bdellovibrionota bacterium]
MKAGYLAFAALLALSSTAMAKEISMICHDQYYACFSDDQDGEHCSWLTGIGKERTVTLTQDASYPNSNFPYEIWNGAHKEKANGGAVEIGIRFNTNPGWSPVHATIAVSKDGATAESSGETRAYAALRQGKTGTGFLCHSLSVK